MADKAKVFGLLKLIDTGTVFKIEYGGTVRFIINKTTGYVTIGATDGSPNTTLGANILGAASYATAPKFIQGQTTTPSLNEDEIVEYVIGSKKVFAYDDGGTVRYKYLDMAGTGVTWVHTTTPPTA